MSYSISSEIFIYFGLPSQKFISQEISLSMIKNLKKIKTIIDFYLNYRNESGFSTRMTSNFRKKLRSSCHQESLGVKKNPKMSKYAYQVE